VRGVLTIVRSLASLYGLLLAVMRRLADTLAATSCITLASRLLFFVSGLLVDMARGNHLRKCRRAALQHCLHMHHRLFTLDQTLWCVHRLMLRILAAYSMAPASE
jgi:hypothetical protein